MKKLRNYGSFSACIGIVGSSSATDSITRQFDMVSMFII